MNKESLLPPNASPAQHALAATMARISAIPMPLGDLYNPATCSTASLPWLAWAFSCDAWDSAWSESQKRQTIADSVYIHRQKGTPAAMRRALAALDYPAKLEEWHQLQPRGDPFTFGIELEILDIGIPDMAGFERLESVIHDAKNARSELRYIRMHSTRRAGVYVGGAILTGQTINVDSEPALLFEAKINGEEQALRAVATLRHTLHQQMPENFIIAANALKNCINKLSNKGYW